jgi:hypothetical protein
MYYSYVEIEYVATSFSPARMDSAVKLLRSHICSFSILCVPLFLFSPTILLYNITLYEDLSIKLYKLRVILL